MLINFFDLFDKENSFQKKVNKIPFMAMAIANNFNIFELSWFLAIFKRVKINFVKKIYLYFKVGDLSYADGNI